jgi:hypothetical protein
VAFVGDEHQSAHPPSSDPKERVVFKRRRFKQQLTLQDRLAAWSKKIEQEAAKLPHGPEGDALIQKARRADVANHLNEWAKSPGLQPPK